MSLVRHHADLFSTEYQLDWPAGLLPIPVRMTVIRLSDGQLVLHSPGPITPGLREELGALGRVGFVVVPQMHGKFAAQAAAAFPSARLLAAPAAPSRRGSLAFHSSLEDQPPAEWMGEVDCHLVLGFRLHEVVLLHRPSRTLVVTDLCFNVRRSPSRAARTFFRANGMWQRLGPSRLIRLLGVSDRGAFAGSLDRVMQWDFDRIVPGHGDVLEHGGPAALRAAWLG